MGGTTLRGIFMEGATVVGATVAGITGMCLGAGYCLLHDDSSSTELVKRRAMGGALLITGIYLWSPFWMHQMQSVVFLVRVPSQYYLSDS